MVKVMYVVLTRNACVKGARSSASLYTTKGRAQNQARDPGDCVMEVRIDLDQEPLFIRATKLKSEE